MQDDLIVVDDNEPSGSGLDTAINPASFFGHTATPATPVSTVSTSGRPRRAASMAQTPIISDPLDRLRAPQKAKMQPKLKLKLSEKAAAQAPGLSFLGPYDRELDSDDEEPLVFEEQFVLRLPQGEDCERLRKIVSSREVSDDVWFKFKDSRRGIFHIGNSTYSSRLVDLPCVIESQKTLDNKQMFKVADICQMLVVEDRIADEHHQPEQKFEIDEFLWPHGITPPLHWARKRRFRKRINKRTIESVEEAVERLLEADAQALEVKYEILENVNPDLSDSELVDRDPTANPITPGPTSEAGDLATPADLGEDDGGHDKSDEEQDGDIDEELAAELDMVLGDQGRERDEDDDEDEDDEDDSDEEEEDEDDETSQSMKLLNEEIRDLTAAVAKKEHEIASSSNPLIKRRFEDALRKLKADLEMKVAQRDEAKERQRLQREGISPEDVERGPSVDQEDNEDDLFGDDGQDDMMEIG